MSEPWTFPCCGRQIPITAQFPNQRVLDGEYKHLTYDCPFCFTPLAENNLVIEVVRSDDPVIVRGR